jgi:hypothetical protein
MWLGLGEFAAQPACVSRCQPTLDDEHVDEDRPVPHTEKKCKETTGLHIMLAQLGDLDVSKKARRTPATAPPVRFLLFLQL